MHRGTVFIITKDNNNNFEVQKSTEFNGGMGIDCLGKVIYEKLKNLKEPLLFDAMIRDFDEEYFKYFDEVMTYVANSQERPFIDKDERSFFEYALKDSQFKFFKDDNEEYIYTSDSNYIKNMSDENITIVCSNGNYSLKPNQILIADYNECINNTKMTFGKNIDKMVKVDDLETREYIPTQKQKIIFDSVIETLEAFNYGVYTISENGMINGMEIETWTNEGVNMIHLIQFYEDFTDIYDVKKINKQIEEIADNFSVDDEIDLHRESCDYRQSFSIKDSLEDFEEYEKKLKEMSKEFLNKYHKILYEKFIKNVDKEESKNEINY